MNIHEAADIIYEKGKYGMVEREKKPAYYFVRTKIAEYRSIDLTTALCLWHNEYINAYVKLCMDIEDFKAIEVGKVEAET